jgi:hypothetical protein
MFAIEMPTVDFHGTMAFCHRSPGEILSCGIDPIDGGMAGIDSTAVLDFRTIVPQPKGVMTVTGFMNPDARVSGLQYGFTIATTPASGSHVRRRAGSHVRR